MRYATRLMHCMLAGLFHDWLRYPERFSIRERGETLLDSLPGLIRTPTAG